MDSQGIAMSQLTLSQLSVLVVEPSATQRRIITQELQNAGVIAISEADNGESALLSLQNETTDLVVSAFYLPDMTGADLVLKLRHNDATSDTAFLLVSSETRFDLLDPVRQAGAVAVLPKPFTARDLDLALNSTLALLNPEELDFDSYDTESIEVLIVDDSLTARRHIKRVLTAMGMRRFSEADSGIQAMKLIGMLHFDLIVTDYNMPGMDGGELVSQIRHNSAQSSIPILMVTSEENESRLAAVQQAGVSAICDKPFEFDTVRDLMNKMLAPA